MSAHAKSWVVVVAFVWMAASSGCGSSSTDASVGAGAASADAAMERSEGDAGASDDASTDAAVMESGIPSSDSGGDDSSASDRGTSGEAGDGRPSVEAGATADDGDAQVDDGAAGEAAMADASGGDEGTGDAAFACSGSGSRYVTDVVSFMFGPGQNFGQNTFPANVLGPPKGSGCLNGSLDVVSLGNGGSVTMAFAGNEIVDGPGPDFIVFENAFDVNCDPTTPYAELGTVAVSQDGVQWFSFPCTATQYPYGTCAGWHAVFANPDENTIDPTDPATAGGDPFDLADLGLSWARYVRVTDRPDDSNVFDLDAVAIVHPRCP